MTTYFQLHILYFITIVKLNSHITHSSKILKIGRISYFLLKKVEEKQENRTILTFTVFNDNTVRVSIVRFSCFSSTFFKRKQEILPIFNILLLCIIWELSFTIVIKYKICNRKQVHLMKDVFSHMHFSCRNLVSGNKK